MRNLKVAYKIMLSFGLLLAVLIGFGLFSLNKMSVINDQSTIIAENWLPSVVAVGKVEELVGNYRAMESAHILSTDAAKMALFDEELTKLKGEISSAPGIRKVDFKS